ncbi:methyltransferase domain-containing protein [Christiangramia sabulilitoris]|uniref:Methyltransferase domain-containing protein n=1 Tax=Christiangramia sabulilitoris TaxID=2583991 RepID=A0A550I365_9FLAO|nr:methyltransferase domain-containing protein [Christiangramia sabulilitoris]TRO65430.1 methyltransferase domain-containing protein [Christiangramia sabulilitoris]
MNEKFWSRRYKDKNTGWDIGYISTPLKDYIDQLKNKNLIILIPGAGNSYEAEYLFKQGFRNVFICDLAAEPLEHFRQRNPDFPREQILHQDFFDLEGYFDLILEQTFFCAIPVDKREDYARQAFQLLDEGGILAGVFFNFDLSQDGPPFGGNKEEYLAYFSPYFRIDILESCYNSIPPRKGNELFFKFRKIKK